VYLLAATGDYGRADGVDGSNQAAVDAFIAGETLVDVAADDAMTDPMLQPLIAGSEGRFTRDSNGHSDVRFAFAEDAEIEIYSPDDTDDPIVPWDPRTTIEITVGDGTFVNYFWPGDFGGDPTGTLDSTTAVQAAVDAADAVNGTVHLGDGTSIWKISSQIVGKSDTRITSSSGGMGGHGKALLRYTATGTTPALLYQFKQRFEVDHIEVEYTSASFTGHLVSLFGSSISGDIINAHIHHCHFRGNSVATAQSLICCHKVIVSRISECGFDKAADNLLILGDPSQTASYINGVAVVNCVFNDTANHDQGQILIGSTDMEGCTIDVCTFEAGGVDPGIVAIRGSNTSVGDARDCLIYALSIRGSWFGDNIAQLGAWIMGLNTFGFGGAHVAVENCVFDSPGSVSKVMTVGDNGGAFAIRNNRIAGGLAIAGREYAAPNDGNLHIMMSGNSANIPITDTGDEPNTLMRWDREAKTRIDGGLMIAHSSDFEDATFEGAVVMGGKVSSGTGILNIGDRVGFYSRTANISAGNRTCAVVQSGTADNVAEVQLVAGSTPAARLRVNGTGTGFQGNAPIAKPTVTGSRGGNAALASALTALANYGLITDSSS
jgi:hypothetical protein